MEIVFHIMGYTLVRGTAAGMGPSGLRTRENVGPYVEGIFFS